MPKKFSWKDKIDPAFDKFISLFLEILEAIKLPANEGYIHLSKEDPIFRVIENEGFPDFKVYYESTNPDKIISDLESLFGGVEGGEKPSSDMKELMVNFFALGLALSRRQTNVVDRILIDWINTLPHDSKEYYMNSFVFDPIQKMELSKLGVEKQMEIFICHLSNLFSLFFHKIFLFSQKNRDALKELSPQFMQRVLFFAWDITSIIMNGKPLKVLYEEAKSGFNDDSLFKLMQIDKTLFDHDWVRDRTRKAAYSGERSFFKSLSKAMSDDPLKNRKIRMSDFIILTIFWEAGLYRLSIKELLELFNKCGLALKDDETTFRKSIDRFKKTRPQLLSISHLFNQQMRHQKPL